MECPSRVRRIAGGVAVGLASGLLTIAGAQAAPGIEGRPAPSWSGVRDWYNLPDGVEALDIFRRDPVDLVLTQQRLLSRPR